MDDKQIEALAKGLSHGLSKTWKDALVQKSAKSERTATHMMFAGLVLEYDQWSGFGWVRLTKLTPLGLAVRAHITKENGHD